MRHPGRLRPSCPRMLALLAAISALPACAGARLHVHANGAEVPLSFSGSLPDERGNVYVLGHGLEDRGTFKVKATRVSVLYSSVPKAKLDIGPLVNEEVRRRGGDGVVQLEITSRLCALDWLFPLTALPFWPGCQTVVVEGRVVTKKSGAGPDLRPGGRGRTQP